jgi:hypothetical protein
VTRERSLVASRWILFGCGVWLVGLGLYFIFLRPPLLPEDPRYMGASLQQIQQVLPGLAAWLNKVFTVMGGFMASAGVLTLLASGRLRTGADRGFTLAVTVAGIAGVGLMSGVNFALGSDFRWLLLVPALAWLIAVLALARSA